MEPQDPAPGATCALPPPSRPAAPGVRAWVGLAVALHLALGAAFWFVCDDAYISWRYAANLLAGEGLAWNPGETPPVEGYSEFGWVLVAAAVQGAGLAPDTWLPLLSLACGALLTGRVVRFLGRDLVQHPVALAGGALFVGTAIPLGVWSTGGMGTQPALLCLWLFFEALLGSLQRHEGVRAGLAGVGLVLLRADGHLWVFLLGGLALGIARLRRDACLARAAAWACGLPLAAFVAHTALRLGVHGDWLPNTARAKVDLTAFTLERGARYAGSFLLTFPGVALALAAFGLQGRRVLERPTVAALLVTLAALAYSVAVGGDFMCFHRFLLPVWPFGAVLFAKALQALAEDGGSRRHAALALVAVVVTTNALPGAGLEVVPQRVRETCWFRFNARDASGAMLFRSEREQWQDMAARAREWRRLGEALAEHASPDDRLCAGAIGAVGWASGLVVHDQFGLTRRDVASFPEVPGERSPGHDRYASPSWFQAEGATIARAAVLDARVVAQRGAPPPHVRVIPLDPDRYGANQALVLEGFPSP